MSRRMSTPCTSAERMADTASCSSSARRRARGARTWRPAATEARRRRLSGCSSSPWSAAGTTGARSTSSQGRSTTGPSRRRWRCPVGSRSSSSSCATATGTSASSRLRTARSCSGPAPWPMGTTGRLRCRPSDQCCMSCGILRRGSPCDTPSAKPTTLPHPGGTHWLGAGTGGPPLWSLRGRGARAQPCLLQISRSPLARTWSSRSCATATGSRGCSRPPEVSGSWALVPRATARTGG
mmetsp:Transcript_48695/g.139218  ORF Transcript_48695/g.139218 Transcript_48695/m.139218 type:complete len:238 (+) Transcript_48695:974-1687(+)